MTGLASLLFIGGTLDGQYVPVPDELQKFYAAEPAPDLYAFREPEELPIRPALGQLTYERRQFGGSALTGRTQELTLIDGYMLPYTPLGRVDLFVLQGHKPKVRTLTLEAFLRTPGVRMVGPWK